MANGKECADDLDFDQKIGTMKQRDLLEFVARQTLEQSKDIGKVYRKVAAIDTRSLINRIALLVLIATLIALGVIDKLPILF